MRKLLSSIFMLIILLLSLWAISAWFMGKNNADFLQAFIDKNNIASNRIFTIEVTDYSSSIFGSTAKVSLSKNPENSLVNVIESTIDSLLLDVEMKNGPIIFNNGRMGIGKSVWKISVNDQNSMISSNENAGNWFFKQLPSSYISHTFDNTVKYNFPVKSTVSDITLKGIYDIKKSENTGSIVSKKIEFKHRDYVIKMSDINFRFKVLNSVINETVSSVADKKNLFFKMENAQLLYQHKNMDKPIQFRSSYNGSMIINNNKLSAKNNISLDNKVNAKYPIDSAKLEFKVTDLGIERFLALSNHLSTINNFKQQKQWILEEQGEVPEGQDQIWQLQDQINQYKKQLRFVATKALTKDSNETPVFTFKANSHYQGQRSRLAGRIEIQAEKPFVDDISDATILGLSQINAEVSLDNLLYNYISAQLPINKKQFSLTYKQNKLLMQ